MTKISNSFHLISLGCAKNTVDSDSMAQLLETDGYHATSIVEDAEVLIVNTCGFIESAREESYDVLRTLADNKQPGQILIASGCLTQRYGREVAEHVPGIDGVMGTRRWMDIVKLVQKVRGRTHPEPQYHLPDTPVVGSDEKGILRASVMGTSAYLKIADGCRRPCAFCAIPLIKGTTISRPIDVIIREAKELEESGIREINLIAQDTTDYGHDLGLKDGLAVLLERLTKEAAGIDWIRIMYAFPGFVSDRLIDSMASNSQILPYLDIPLQHAHPETLKRMRRPANIDWVHRTLEKMRSSIPGLAIRTTFIVGYPGETDKEFDALMTFIKEIRFDRVGTFKFSFEPGTTSEPLGDPIREEIKEARYQELMETQQAISLQINQSFVGKNLDVLIEGLDKKEGISIGRSYRDAPEIDGMVVVEGLEEPGSIVPIHITSAMAYDLAGSPSDP